MRPYFAYVRVSTVRQGEGVSLAEQRRAIERYALANHLDIVAWHEELETAAKHGRRIFQGVLRELKRHRSAGLIIHKIDRGARNLRDWADLGDLIDSGIDVRFVHDNLDLGSRGGRLAADIQAVIAADYIRNLREEVLKGIEGRLRQGLYPSWAPVGYLNRGRGQVKVIDPVKGPIVARAFELYATGDYSIRSVLELVTAEGLTSHSGKPLMLSNLARLLHNPFYMGVLKLGGHPEFPGIHEPLIPSALFNQVQQVIGGRRPRGRVRHSFLYRLLLGCRVCGRALIGELKKGHTYYRCHGWTCQGTSLRQEVIDAGARTTLATVSIEIGVESTNQLLEHWRRSKAKQVAHNQPRLQEAIARTPTAYRCARERTDRFREFVRRPDQVFTLAPTLVQRELVKLMLDGSTDKKEFSFVIRPPFDVSIV